MTEGASAVEPCEHYWSWVSPAGTSNSARLCMLCHQPDPEWLNSIVELHPMSSDRLLFSSELPVTVGFDNRVIVGKATAFVRDIPANGWSGPSKETYLNVKVSDEGLLSLLLESYDAVMLSFALTPRVHLAREEITARIENGMASANEVTQHLNLPPGEI